MGLRLLRTVLLAGACHLLACGAGQAAWGAEVAVELPGMQAAQACDAAGAEAERRYDVPPGLLRAIGRVESGRRNPGTGLIAPWPWTINAEGQGQVFGSQSEALATTRRLQGSGVALIDVGCFQINLVHHPAAFVTLDEGFDPQHNADYAGRFLQSLRVKTGSWEAAVAAYHSATPERGEPYRDRVLAGWSREGGSAAALVSPPALAVAAPAVRTVVWSPAALPSGQSTAKAGGPRIWGPSAVGQGASVIRITRG